VSYRPPPPGWYTFGYHADVPSVVLEFSEETDAEGFPRWERPTGIAIDL
jgi:hypothetical protein